MTTRKKTILYSVLVILITAVLVGYYQYTRKPAAAGDIKSDVTIMAREFAKEYADNEDASNKKYLNKLVEVRGKVASVAADAMNITTISLQTNDPLCAISCQMATRSSGYNDVHNGDSISVKGFCAGLLSDVILVRSVLVPTP